MGLRQEGGGSRQVCCLQIGPHPSLTPPGSPGKAQEASKESLIHSVTHSEALCPGDSVRFPPHLFDMQSFVSSKRNTSIHSVRHSAEGFFPSKREIFWCNGFISHR